MSSAVSAVASAVSGAVSSVGSAVASAASSIYNGISDFIADVSNVVLEFVEDVWAIVVEFLNNLFGGGRDIVTVGTSVVRVIPDSDIVPSWRIGLAEGLFDKIAPNQLVEHVLEAMSTCIGIRAERMLAYGKENLSYGAPIGEVLHSNLARAACLEVVKGLTNPNITFDYYYITGFNSLHGTWERLNNSYGYNSLTNELASLTTLKGTAVYLKDITIITKTSQMAVIREGELEQWGYAATCGYTPERAATAPELRKYIAHTPNLVVDNPVYLEAARVDYVWQDANGIHTENILIELPSIVDASMYYQIKYLDNGREYYWTYTFGSGVYPTIDNGIYTGPSPDLDIFPNIYFILGRAATDADKSSPDYKASVQCMKKLGLSFQSTIDEIKKSPNIAFVEQAFMAFAVPAVTTNEMEQHYLFDFFSKIHITAGDGGIGAFIPVTATTPYTPNNAKIRITLNDAKLNMVLSCEGITRKSRVGTVCPTGEYDSTTTFTERTITTSTNTSTVQVPQHHYRYQVTPNVYEEITVHDLQMTYHIWGDYKVVASASDMILLIPLDANITKTYGVNDRELLYTRSLHYVFNSKQVQHVEWYQEQIFMDIIMVASIVLTVYTLGTSSYLTAAAAAFAAGAYVFAVMLIVVQIAIIVAAAAAYKLFVQQVGAERALAISALLLAYSLYTGVNSTSSLKYMPDSRTLLSLSSGLSSAIQPHISELLADIENEHNIWKQSTKEQQERLESARAQLNQTTIVSPLLLIGETPDMFYTRTLGMGNGVDTALDAVHNFVPTALTLPKLSVKSDSDGGFS